MIAAAVAAMGAGAFAGLCDDVTVDPELPGCALYDVSIKVNTLGPKWMKCSKFEMDNTVYFEKTTRKFDGILWMCEDVCDDFAGGPNFVLWEKKTGCCLTAPLAWNGKEFEADVASFDIIDRFSKKANKVEMFWTMPTEIGDLYAAGIGSMDMKKMLPKSVSGNIVGMITPSALLTSEKAHCEDPEVSEFFGLLLPLCDEFEDWCCDGEEASAVVAYGTWSIKYNKSLSKGKKSLKNIVPAYAQ